MVCPRNGTAVLKRHPRVYVNELLRYWTCGYTGSCWILLDLLDTGYWILDIWYWTLDINRADHEKKRNCGGTRRIYVEHAKILYLVPENITTCKPEQTKYQPEPNSPTSHKRALLEVSHSSAPAEHRGPVALSGTGARRSNVRRGEGSRTDFYVWGFASAWNFYTRKKAAASFLWPKRRGHYEYLYQNNTRRSSESVRKYRFHSDIK